MSHYRHRTHYRYHYWWYAFPPSAPVPPPLPVDPALIAYANAQAAHTRAVRRARTAKVIRWAGWAIARHPILFTAWVLAMCAAAGLHLSWLGDISAGLGTAWAVVSWRDWGRAADAARIRHRWEDDAHAPFTVERVGTPPFDLWAVTRGQSWDSLWHAEAEARECANALNGTQTPRG